MGACALARLLKSKRGDLTNVLRKNTLSLRQFVYLKSLLHLHQEVLRLEQFFHAHAHVINLGIQSLQVLVHGDAEVKH